ncbi:hypothetical protein [Streptosporangium sp. NPDC049376]|uniref:hypothetical protein n=1 Tax=Streptosporangium sp. NPDC049376 TaxID=3366192 RepID=UPI0037B4ECE6
MSSVGIELLPEPADDQSDYQHRASAAEQASALLSKASADLILSREPRMEIDQWAFAH